MQETVMLRDTIFRGLGAKRSYLQMWANWGLGTKMILTTLINEVWVPKWSLQHCEWMFVCNTHNWISPKIQCPICIYVIFLGATRSYLSDRTFYPLFFQGHMCSKKVLQKGPICTEQQKILILLNCKWISLWYHYLSKNHIQEIILQILTSLQDYHTFSIAVMNLKVPDMNSLEN